MWTSQTFIDERHIKPELSGVVGFELARLQFDDEASYRLRNHAAAFDGQNRVTAGTNLRYLTPRPGELRRAKPGIFAEYTQRLIEAIPGRETAAETVPAL